jgi:hypothetical protein
MKVAIRIVDSLPALYEEATPTKRHKIDNAGFALQPAEARALMNPISTDTLTETNDEPSAGDHNAKATKADDAEVPEYLWNRVLTPTLDPAIVRALRTLRNFALRWWKLALEQEFMSWFSSSYPDACLSDYIYNTRPTTGDANSLRDWKAGMDCLRRSRNSGWWEWSDGSRPFFWRWVKEYQEVIRDGLPIWELEDLPRWFVPQRAERIQYMQEAVRRKLLVVRRRRYIVPGTVLSLTSLFAVPKGDTDIRLVYDGTKSGLNRAVWAPWFPLPTVEAHLRCVEPGTYMGDIDIGEMFLNFMLHPRMQQYAGVDLTPFFPEEVSNSSTARRVLWELWTRCGMGFKFSPYQTVQGVLFADVFIRGDRMDPTNVLRWARVVLNLPGSPTYTPSAS